MRSVLFAVAMAVLFGTRLVTAGELLTVELQTVVHHDAQLVVVGSDRRETIYTPSELEKLPIYRLETTTPWRNETTIFEGVLLAGILQAVDLATVNSILVVAENDYKTVISKPVRTGVEILVATRVNGIPHTRRARGPIQFIIDADAYTASDLADESALVWMAARIEAGS